MGPLNNLVELNKDILDSNKKLIEITDNIFKVLKGARQCHDCKHSMGQDDEILYRKDVMLLLKISAATYYRFKDEGILVPMKMGRRDYYLKSSLLELIEDRKRKGRY